MTPHAVDANAIALYQSERIAETEGPATARIAEIFHQDCIALDNEKLCEQEWVDTAGGKFPFALKDWIADQQIYGRIKYYDLANNNIKKDLSALGMPTKDHKWVRLAMGCGGNVILTQDIDFFDPTKKKASAKEKEKIRNCQSGACSKALQKKFGVTVQLFIAA